MFHKSQKIIDHFSELFCIGLFLSILSIPCSNNSSSVEIFLIERRRRGRHGQRRKNKKLEKLVIFDFFVLEIFEKFDNLILNDFLC
jgi:hypothetical protein